MNTISHDQFFAILMAQLAGDYTCVSTLSALLQRQADLAFIPVSRRDIAADLGGRVTAPTALRALAKLESLGLIECQARPRQTSLYRVNVDALRTLLATPISPAHCIPGLTPLPALERIFGAAGENPNPLTPMTSEGSHHD